MDRRSASQYTKPVLIYDGDCGFCIYWVKYWEKLTGNRVDYQPYQAVAEDFPSISVESFQRAVQYIAPDGKIASAAEASFLTLSHAKEKRFWLWMYRHIPGFAFISEKIYALIASHREFFYWFSLLLWGRGYEPSQYALVSWLFLRGLGVIFLVAFVSFGVQALGLIGSQGIFPVEELTIVAKQQLSVNSYWLLPMVFWLNTSDLFIQVVCWGGAAISLLLIFNSYPRICLLLLYTLYLSLIIAGQTFMTFQWDLFLIETGLIAFFLVGQTKLGIWLLRWLLFRFIFAGGAVKLLSGDPSWRDFTALNYHFLTQPLPTPVAWYAYLLPEHLLQFGAFSTLFIELGMVFLIFFPRHLRFLAGFSILLLQSVILITGNYNFFNLQTMLLCIVLFDDTAIEKILPNRLIAYLKHHIKTAASGKVLSTIGYSFALITIALSIVQGKIRITGTAPYTLLWVQDRIAPFRFVNTYGPFAIMTKDRMEIVIEGSYNGIDWEPYVFRYKPGDIHRRPLWNIPHQPRVDWQMWFAALGSVNENTWFIRMMQRLLENSQPVKSLFLETPFGEDAPRFIRAEFYEYYFSTPTEKQKEKIWWTRRYVGEYYPPVSLSR